MLSIRIVTTAAIVAAMLDLAIAGAAAQSAAESPGRPLPLLQFVHHTGKIDRPQHPRFARRSAERQHPRFAHELAEKQRAKLGREPAEKTSARERIARRAVLPHDKAVAQARPQQTPAGTGAISETAWPAAAGAAPGAIATVAPPQTPAQIPASVSTEKVVATDPNQIVSDGDIAQLASPAPAPVNATDLTVDDRQMAAPPPAATAPAKASALQSAVAQPTPAKSAPAASVPAVHALVARAAVHSPATPDLVGSASWIAQVLAALGGAITAGAVAWFLIRPAPERNYN